MSASISPQPDPSAVGGIAQAPFALPPDPPKLFLRRAERFGRLSEGGALAPYLRFLAALTRAQGELCERLPEPEAISPEQRQRAREHAMPPLDRGRLARDGGVAEALEAFFDMAAAIDMPPAAAEALDTLQGASPEARAIMIGNLAADSVPVDELATHLFLAAGLQVHAARLASTLQPAALVPVGTGLCPTCGGPPVCSMVVGFLAAEGARYAVCAFCATLWNEVRLKCLACGSTKGIGYRAVEDGSGAATVKAEVCDECRSWMKILYQNKNPSLDAVADDVGSLGLDLLMRDTPYRRAGFDTFLLGY
jgi:FdhE protein